MASLVVPSLTFSSLVFSGMAFSSLVSSSLASSLVCSSLEPQLGLLQCGQVSQAAGLELGVGGSDCGEPGLGEVSRRLAAGGIG